VCVCVCGVCVCVCTCVRESVSHLIGGHGRDVHLAAQLPHAAGVGCHGDVEVHAVAVVHAAVALLAELRWRLLCEHAEKEGGRKGGREKEREREREKKQEEWTV